MKRLLKMIMVGIYRDVISPHMVVIFFAASFLISYPFLSDYNGGLPFLFAIACTSVFCFVFKKLL